MRLFGSARPADLHVLQASKLRHGGHEQLSLHTDTYSLSKRPTAILAYFENDTLYSHFHAAVMSEVKPSRLRTAIRRLTSDQVSFAKQFLATLDKRLIKLPADHVSDPRQYPAQSPVRNNSLGHTATAY